MRRTVKREQVVKRWKFPWVYTSYYIIHMNSAPISHKSHPPHNYCPTLTRDFVGSIWPWKNVARFEQKISVLFYSEMSYAVLGHNFLLFTCGNFKSRFTLGDNCCCLAVLKNGRFLRIPCLKLLILPLRAAGRRYVKLWPITLNLSFLRGALVAIQTEWKETCNANCSTVSPTPIALESKSDLRGKQPDRSKAQRNFVQFFTSDCTSHDAKILGLLYLNIYIHLFIKDSD
jgi:hypothetical protein